MALLTRSADASEIDALARIWFDGWRDAHLAVAPPELARVRTLELFRTRMAAAALADVGVVGPQGAPLGFFMLKGDELSQFYVSATARGTGAAAILMDAAERELAARGVETSWLTCAVGNDRAARFYEKRGWRNVETFADPLETPAGIIPIDVWRFEKKLLGSA